MLVQFSKKWIRKKEGSTAIEFSLLAIPYFMLTLGIIELSIMFTSATLLEGATGSAARLIRTGQLQQSGGDPETLFRNALCGYATVLVDCQDVVIEVQQMNSFNDFGALNAQFDTDGNMVSQGVDVGGANDRVLIRTFYRYEMMTPFVGPLLAGSDNAISFLSTVVSQTEPYDFGGI